MRRRQRTDQNEPGSQQHRPRGGVRGGREKRESVVLLLEAPLCRSFTLIQITGGQHHGQLSSH